tara:strand:- start:606 stop:1460 length:855 start_codon:yes stop_codon:yes gene_type:complete
MVRHSNSRGRLHHGEYDPQTTAESSLFARVKRPKIARMSRMLKLPGFVLLLHVALLLSVDAKPTEWPLKDGNSYFGEAVSYSFTTKQVGLRKADGKEHLFPAKELAISGKLQLMGSPAFGEALKGYKPPFIPTLVWIFGSLLALCFPVIVGLWGSAHVLGAVSTMPRHLIGVGKLVLLVVIQVVGWLVLSIVLDSERPIIPDKNADIVLLITVGILGLIVTSVVLSLHYHLRFMKGMAIALLSGVFGGIVATAMLLGGLFLVTRMETPMETLATKLVFEPFGWF